MKKFLVVYREASGELQHGIFSLRKDAEAFIDMLKAREEYSFISGPIAKKYDILEKGSSQR